MINFTEIDIELEETKLEYVNELHTHWHILALSLALGQIISPRNEMEKEVNKEFASGWKKYWSLKEINIK